MDLISLFKYFLELGIVEKLVFTSIILALSFLQYFCLRQRLVVAVPALIVLHVFFAFFLGFIGSYTPSIHLFYFIPTFIITFLLYLVFPNRTKEITSGPWVVKFPVVKGKPVVIENLKRGLAIFGSAGAGKTESVFIPIIENAARHNITGISYDYKDGELTEIVNHFYSTSRVKTFNIIPHRPKLSHRVNPIHPDYINSPEMVNELVNVLFANMRSGSKQEKNFFMEVPESILSGVIWRLKTEFPDKCTLPHAIAICMMKSAKELTEFLEKNTQAKLMSAPFFDSIVSKDQLAGVKASLSNDLRKFAYPSIFYILSENEVDLHVNHPDSPALLNLINSPGKEITQSPFLALIFTTALKLMQKRNMLDSYLLLDEAATLSLPNFSKIPATMRSFNIGTVFSLQDKILGSEKFGDTTVRAILSNLSYQVIGKTNDPESVRYYKQISEEIERVQYSKSFADGFMPKGETRKTESLRETSKYKNQDFFGLNTGEFIVFSDGTDRKVNFDLIPFDRVTLKERNHITDYDLQSNYERILKEAQEL